RFDLLSADTGPHAHRDGGARRKDRVLPLGHLEIREDAPERGGDQQHPRNLAVLDEEPRRVVRVGDDLFVGFPVAHGSGLTVSPSFTSVAPRTMIRCPTDRPSVTTMMLPSASPSLTGRRRATLLSC